MGLELIRAEHNRRALLTKTEKNWLFHPMMDLLRNSRLFFALTVNPQMYVSTLREFWANTTITTHDDKHISISSSIQSTPVTITPEILNTHLELQDDATCVLSFDKTAMQSAFVDVGYARTFSEEDTLWKGYLPSPYKYLLHTLMLCFSKKCGCFDQASTHMQELFYSLIKNQKYSLSNYIFRDLVANHYEKSNKFLMYPRFLSFVLSKLLDQSVIEQGGAVYMNGQTVKVFTSMASAAIVPIETVETPPSVKPTKKSMSSRKRKPAQTPPVEPRQSKRAKKGVQEDEVHEPAAETQTRKTKVVVPEEAHLDHEPIAEPRSSAHEPIDFHQQSSILTYKRRSSKRPRGDNIIKTSTTTTLLHDTSLEVVEQRYPGCQETTTGGEIEHTGDEGSLNPELKVKKLKAIFTYLSSKMLALENRVITQGLEIDELRMQLAKKHEHHTAAAPVVRSASEKVGRLDVGMELKVDFKGETLTKGSFNPKVKPLKEVIVTGFADEPKSAGESLASEAKLPSEKAHTALDTLANLASLAILREDTASPEAILYERIPDTRPYEWREEGPQIQKSKAQRRDDQWIVSELSKLTSTNILRCNHCSASTSGSGGSVVFYPSCNDQDPIQISYSDIDLLALGGWLNDSIMNFYLRYLQLNVTPTNGAISDYHFCNTFFYDKLKEVLSPKVVVPLSPPGVGIEPVTSPKGGRLSYHPARSASIHEPFHWSLVIICMCGKGHKAGPIILHFDSFGTRNKSQIVENIKRFVEEEVKLGSLKSSGQEVNIEVPKQPNTSDCGVYVLLYIEHFIQQAPKRMKTEYSTMFGEKWFEEKEASGLRSRIQSLLRDLFKSAPRHAECSPTIQNSDLKMHPVGENESTKANAERSENEGEEEFKFNSSSKRKLEVNEVEKSENVEEEKNEKDIQKPMVKSKNKKYVNKNDTNWPTMDTPAAQVTTGSSEGVSTRSKRPTSKPRRLLD